MDKFNVNTFTLKLALGTIWLVSIFLFVCGIYNLYPFIEKLSSTSTWEVLMPIPTLVVSYMIGELATYISNSTFFRKTSNYIEIDDFLSIIKTENIYLIKRYENMQNQFQFFRTCFPTSIFFGFSIIWSSFFVFKASTLGIKEICISLGLLIIISSPFFVMMAKKKKAEIKYLIKVK